MKTNAARLLDQLGIRYELRSYEVDAEHLDAGSRLAVRVRRAKEQAAREAPRPEGRPAS